MEMMRLKKGDNKSDNNVRSRSNSRERVSLLGTSNDNNNRSTNNGNRLRGRSRENKLDNDDGKEERVSLLTGGGGSSAGKLKRNSKYNNNNKSRGKSSFNNLLNKNNKPPWTMTRLMKYGALLLVSASMSFLLLRKESKVIHWEEYHNILEPGGSKETRCFEESRSSRDERCSCPDPNKALANDDAAKVPLWKNNHDHMINQAKNAPKELDIVFFGDGMIEQLSGTRGLGAESVEGMEEYFERKFTKKKNGGAKFSAIALGSSGDTGPNLLWHWENGIQQANLRPKLWFIMVGGNDLFIDKCTDRFVMANVLNVAKRIFEDQPEAKIVIHGITPRKDTPRKDGKDRPDSKSNALGHMWNRAQGVNLEVRKFIKIHSSRIYFMNVGQTLLANGGMKGRKFLDPNLIRDGINPTPKGMEKWADLVVKKLTPILRGFDMEKHRNQNKKDKKESKDGSTTTP